LKIEKKKYLVAAEEAGGTAREFRKLIGEQYEADPFKFDSLVLQALLEAATRTWEAKPRNRGPDLFSINEFVIPEYLTRYHRPDEGTDDDDDELQFEKVDQKFATVDDLYDDATIKMRKAAQSAAAAEEEMRAADEARRRASGNRGAYLKDIVDS
jgi:hypothetical protein